MAYCACIQFEPAAPCISTSFTDCKHILSSKLSRSTMKRLLLLVIALCVTCTSSGHLLGNGITLSRAQTEAHKILRRQDPLSQVSECSMLISSRNCNNGLGQELADNMQGCNESVVAQSAQAITANETQWEHTVWLQDNH